MKMAQYKGMSMYALYEYISLQTASPSEFGHSRQDCIYVRVNVIPTAL